MLKSTKQSYTYFSLVFVHPSLIRSLHLDYKMYGYKINGTDVLRQETKS